MPSCTSMCVVPALCSDGRYRVGYVGVEVGPGKYDLSKQAIGRSRLGFELAIEGTGSVENEVVVVTGFYLNRPSGVPAPKCARSKLTKARAELEHFASDAAEAGAPQLQNKLDVADLSVACRYIGVIGRLAVDDVEANVVAADELEFEWALQSGDWGWEEIVAIRRKDVPSRPVPLPRCAVTHQKLVAAAAESAHAISKEYGAAVSCRCLIESRVARAFPPLCSPVCQFAAPQVRRP